MSVEDYQTLRNDYEMSINDLTISKKSTIRDKERCVFSGKELDINDIKLSELDHRLFVLDDLINSAYVNNNSIKI